MTITTNNKKIVLTLAIVLTCILAIGYWLYGKLFVTTDDAYVNAHVVQIAARVNGQVAHLYVSNNQYVKAGQALFVLDPATYQASVQQYQAALQYTQAKLTLAQINADRALRLYAVNAVAKQDADTAVSNLKSTIAEKEAANAYLQTALLNLQYTHITAPTSGWITNLSLREGDTINANQPLFALVSDQEFWIDANFKETDLHNIRVGQPVDVKVDMYPGHHFNGIVESISSGSGNVFSLLPPENATGNWVKVTQRVPVRINITQYDPKFPLRIGTSAFVKIRAQR